MLVAPMTQCCCRVSLGAPLCTSIAQVHTAEPVRCIAPACPPCDPQSLIAAAVQTHEPCFWFGARTSCRRWHVMAGCAGVLTSADLALSVFYGMSGSRVGSSGRGSRFHRCAGPMQTRAVENSSFGASAGAAAPLLRAVLQELLRASKTSLGPPVQYLCVCYCLLV